MSPLDFVKSYQATVIIKFTTGGVHVNGFKIYKLIFWGEKVMAIVLLFGSKNIVANYQFLFQKNSNCEIHSHPL